MAFGKLFTSPGTPRSTGILAVAKANNLELEIVDTDTKNPTPEFLKFNPMSKMPTFVGADGYVLTECMAIAIYVTSQNEKTTLLGKTKQDYASILKWMSFFNTELLLKLSAWYKPILGTSPYNKKAVEDAQKEACKAISVVDAHLQKQTYLVGERITLADLFCTGLIARGFDFFFDKKWRQANPHVSRWYETVANQPVYSAVAPKLQLIDTPKLTNQPPKKAEQPKKEAAAKETAKAKSKKVEEEEEPTEPKPKHPLDLLPRATFALDEWKRFYSNHAEPEALKWFWEKVNFDEYSIWKVHYKYNDELTLIFMSNNLIGGFNTRLEASRKYLFGCASVFGENNASVIQGAFMIRGHDYKAVFDVAPDYESYDFVKLDPTKAEDRAFVELQWTWDLPITVDGKELKRADGKVFK